MTVIRGPEYSDGDASHRPHKTNYTRANEEAFMQKIATKWMEEEGGGVRGKFMS